MQPAELEKIIQSIKPMEELFPYPKELCKQSNCYSFALGITFPGNPNDHYYLGFTDPNNNSATDPPKIKDYVCTDLKNLGYDYRIFNTLTDKLEPNEELLKFFFFQSEKYPLLWDFHVAKRNKDGLWYHKIGWNEPPRIVEIQKGAIVSYGEEPDQFCFFDIRKKILATYLPVCYFAISR